MTDTRLTILDWLRNRHTLCSKRVIVQYTGFSEAYVTKTLDWLVENDLVMVDQSGQEPRYGVK